MQYPKTLEKVFHKLLCNGMKPIIVGGFVRDYFLGIDSKDIDVEVYNVPSFFYLEQQLIEFGNVNSVGESFGVCKLKIDSLEIDFSLPRKESKVGDGHRGFDVEVYPSLDFKTAARRRDFTINAIGYDVATKRFLDPFEGRKDIEHKILRVVDTKTFIQDPLRVFRAMQFSARFEFQTDLQLLSLARSMVEKKDIHTLTKERIFLEFEKLFYKSKHPSIGILFLQNIGAFDFFYPLKKIQNLNKHLFALDNVKDERVELCFTILSFEDENLTFLKMISDDKTLQKNIKKLLNVKNFLEKLPTLCDYELYYLAQQVQMKKLLLLAQAYHIEKIEPMIAYTKQLNIYTQPLLPLIQGRDLIKLGLTPSKEFSTILEKIYDMQMQGKFDGYSYEKVLEYCSLNFKNKTYSKK